MDPVTVIIFCIIDVGNLQETLKILVIIFFYNIVLVLFWLASFMPFFILVKKNLM